MKDRNWFTVPEAAARIGISVNSAYRLLLTRQLGCRKVGPSGTRYQITERHIAAYLAACEVPVADDVPMAEPAGQTPPRARRGRGERLDGSPAKYF